jgi:hypothetical protein
VKFRLRAFGLHLAASAAVLTLLLGLLYAGWYHWPGWWLAGAGSVFAVLIGVDLVLGPLLTLVVAAPAKSRRELSRDIGVIAAIQLLALGFGVAQLWNGRVLYYAFSESVLQIVQAYDIPREAARLGADKNPALAPHWYSLPRWIWAPLPADAAESDKIIKDSLGGGFDVTGMPVYYQRWEAGLPALKKQLKGVDGVSYFFPKEKKVLREKMQALGLSPDEPVCITLVGRGHWLLAVFDPQSMSIRTLLSAK